MDLRSSSRSQGEIRGEGGNREPWSGLALMTLGGYVVAQAHRWPYYTADGPGAGFFPLWYGVAMLALSAFLVVTALRRRGVARPRADRRGIRRALATWLALAVAVASFEVIGFTAGFALLTFFLVAVLYRRPWKVAAVVAGSSAVGFYLVFPLALGVDLPVGLLGF